MHDDNFTKGTRGEFRGDFTRDTFDPLRHFSRVLMQQGRVQLDADWNEQVSIIWHYLRRLGAHLMGPHGTPTDVDGKEGNGFEITEGSDKGNFNIGPGVYYVDGILCENIDELTYRTQPNLPFFSDEDKPLVQGKYLVYLDVWERHISYVEDDYMREKALAGPDTATRAKIVWQVKVISHKALIEIGNNPIDPSQFKSDYHEFLEGLVIANIKKPGSGKLRARARKVPEDDNNPCLTAPEASYRGPENQLYRVEIHRAGIHREDGKDDDRPTFKWSRENGSVIFPIREFNGGTVVTLEHLGKDCRTGLKANDWVEIVDDGSILRNRAENLVQILEVDSENMQVTLKDTPGSNFETGMHPEKHPYLRRWDQKGNYPNGEIAVKEGDSEQDWILLEDGVEIQFPLPNKNNDKDPDPHVYQTGDYWLIPARTATGDVEWPGPVDAPEELPPQGVEHHYAPLWNITVDMNGNVSASTANDLRRKLKKNWD